MNDWIIRKKKKDQQLKFFDAVAFIALNYMRSWQTEDKG